MRFTLDGRSFELRRDQVEEAMAGVAAEPLRGRAVQVSETWHPGEQVLERADGVGRSDVICTAAYRHPKKLGSPVRHDEPRPKFQGRLKRA